MRIGQVRRTGRQAFTLVELLIVIAIIGILLSLLLGAVTKAMHKIAETKTRTDISQLSQAVQAFQTHYQTPWIPSYIKLCENYSSYGSSKLDIDSIQYLQKVWPKIIKAGGGSWSSSNGVINWSGNPNITSSSKNVYTLPGWQCLVFFLGGIPVPPDPDGSPHGTRGFSTNPRDPSDFTSSIVPPFFEFKQERLYSQPLSTNTPPGSGNGFYGFIDGYGNNVYAYFSSYKQANGYNRYFQPDAKKPDYNTLSDCPDLAASPDFNPWPYLSSSGSYHNRNTFQIISAGRDGKFGEGTNLNSPTTWDAINASDTYPQYSPGADDMSNFHEKFLGVPNS